MRKAAAGEARRSLCVCCVSLCVDWSVRVCVCICVCVCPRVSFFGLGLSVGITCVAVGAQKRALTANTELSDELFFQVE